MLVGVEAFRNRLQQLGYSGITQDEQYYGYSLALGSAEVTLWQQAQAYRVLARGGIFSPLKILTDDPAPGAHAVLPAGASFIVGDILSDRAARAVTFGLDSSLATGYWSAVKTGTSKDMRDNWCVGYTPRYTVAVWVGNFEGDPMHDVSGITGAAPVWREIMDTLQRGGAALAPKPPVGVQVSLVSFATGKEATRPEWFLTGTQMVGSIASVSPDAQAPQIDSPTNGMIVAIDPDIPSDRQRLPVRVKGNSERLIVRLDDVVLGQAEKGFLWQPRSGAHRIVLEDSAGGTVDQVRFTVR
jgi:penicillin-binding protein 1C